MTAAWRQILTDLLNLFSIGFYVLFVSFQRSVVGADVFSALKRWWDWWLGWNWQGV